MAGPAQTTEVTLTTKPDAPRSHLDALVELATRKAAETVGLGGSDSRDTSARQAANFDGNSDAAIECTPVDISQSLAGKVMRFFRWDMLRRTAGQHILRPRRKNLKIRDVVVACATWAAIGLTALSVQAQTPPPPIPSPAFERAYLTEMDDATRAEVEKRATGGNTVSGVIATMLLNSSQMATHSKAGTPITVVAIDFIRGVVVIQNAPSQYEPVRFDPKTLQVY